MKSLDFRHYALCSSVVAAMLAGCGGSQPPIGAAPGATSGNGDSLPYHKSFYYTGTKQWFKVPAGVTQIDVVGRGAAGGGGDGGSVYGGRGGRVHAVVPVTPGERLAVFVGGTASGYSGMNGGFNGGGSGGCGPYNQCTGLGGGGASDVRQGGFTRRSGFLSLEAEEAEAQATAAPAAVAEVVALVAPAATLQTAAAAEGRVARKLLADLADRAGAAIMVLSPEVLERPDCAATEVAAAVRAPASFLPRAAPGAAAAGDTSAAVVVAAVLAAITRMDTTIVLAAAAAVRRMSSRMRLALRCG
jgi:hypothetical protein